MGLGHVSRLVALAQELQQRDLDYCFHGNGGMKSASQEFITKCGLRSSCQCDQKPDISILDTYNAEFIRNFSLTRIRVLLIDETSPSVLASAYLVASPILSWIPPMGDSRVLAFQNSPILRKEIVIDALDSSGAERTQGLLVILGGVSNDIFEKIIRQLRSANQDILPNLPLSVVCYSSDQIVAAKALNFEIVYPSTDIRTLTSNFFAVISAAGVIAWELAAMSIPGFTIAVVENQEFQVQYLKENNFRDGISASSLNFKDLLREEITKLKTNSTSQKTPPELDGSRKAIDFILGEFSL
jgi:spore coat polysaccharide biosynthesis predicted glycosyltransferase SpsG